MELCSIKIKRPWEELSLDITLTNKEKNKIRKNSRIKLGWEKNVLSIWAYREFVGTLYPK